MGSKGTPNQKQPYGTLMLPLIDDNAKNSDPWKRNYHQPPKFETLIPKSFPLIDIRAQLEDPNYLPSVMLQKYGFGVVKHKSTALFEHHRQLSAEDSDSQLNQDRLNGYYLEALDLVSNTTGARHVFITHSIVRGGKVPEEYEMPKGFDAKFFKDIKEGRGVVGKASTSTQQSDGKKDANDAAEKPVHVPTGQPIRVPHQDYTPLGARQSVRHLRDDIYKAGLQTGVIAAEDAVCRNHAISAESRESDSTIAAEYNKKDQLGPRYAAYSIWRPLRTVRRDPLALCPRANHDPNVVDGQLIYFHYENKVPGPANLGGDFLKEYAVLGLTERATEDCDDANDNSSTLKWYYVSAQEPDEVLFIKLFDSAGLGEDSQHAGAPWHGSPNIGDADNSPPRESVELRVVAFW